MRTKTAKQISDQTLDLMRAIALKHWDGKQYINHAAMMEALRRVKAICWRYVDNIYNAAGTSRNAQIGTDRLNHIWESYAAPVSVYAKQTEV